MIPKRPVRLIGRFKAEKIPGARSLMPPGVEALLTWILIALVSIVIVLGGIALALQENRINNGERISWGATLTLTATEGAQVHLPTYTDCDRNNQFHHPRSCLVHLNQNSHDDHYLHTLTDRMSTSGFVLKYRMDDDYHQSR
jgi:hypothetical protein